MYVIPVFADDVEPTPTPTPNPPSNQDLIDYFEKQKAEQEEKERIKLEEEEKKKEEERIKKEEEETRIAVERANYSSFTSSSEVINGYAQKYGYYFIGFTESNYYQNYVFYGYFFTDLTRFEKKGNTVYFKNGKGKYVSCSNSLGCQVSDLTNQFTLPNWKDIKSNIYEVDYPASQSIDKSYLHLIDYFTKIVASFVSFVALYAFTNWLVINKRKG